MPKYECPTCAKVTTVERNEDAPFRPFCCDRCKMIDLGKWLDGTYTIRENHDTGGQQIAEPDAPPEFD